MRRISGDHEFRRRHLEALRELRGQVRELTRQAGLVTLGDVALDGTKVRAGAGTHQAMSCDRLRRDEPGVGRRSGGAAAAGRKRPVAPRTRGTAATHRGTGCRKSCVRAKLAAGDSGSQSSTIAPAPRGRIPTARSVRGRMRRTKAGRTVHKMRKALAEPVFGRVTRTRGCTRVSPRGLMKVRGAWSLVAAARNICRSFTARPRVEAVLRAAAG